MSGCDMFWPEDPLPLAGFAAAQMAPRIGSKAALPQARRHTAERRVSPTRLAALEKLARDVSMHRCRCKRGRRCAPCSARALVPVTATRIRKKGLAA